MSISTGSSRSSSSSITNRSVSTAEAAAAVVALVAAATASFSLGYWMAAYYTKRRLLQHIHDSTAGCSILLQQQHQQKGQENERENNTIPAPRRFGACIKLKPDKYIEYRTLHDHVWDHVQQRLYQSHIRNFTIYYHAETSTLYQHFEWIGHWYAVATRGAAVVVVVTTNQQQKSQVSLSVEEEQALFDADLYAITQDHVTREWWKLCEPCQQPFAQWYQQQQPQPTQPTQPTHDRVLLLPSEGNTTGDWWAPMECVCHTGHYPVAYTQQTHDPDFMKMDINPKKNIQRTTTLSNYTTNKS
jgi:L-rhamnose mutarotase